MNKYHIEYFNRNRAFINKEIIEAKDDNAAERIFKAVEIPYGGMAKLYSYEPAKPGKFGFDYPASRAEISKRFGVVEPC